MQQVLISSPHQRHPFHLDGNRPSSLSSSSPPKKLSSLELVSPPLAGVEQPAPSPRLSEPDETVVADGRTTDDKNSNEANARTLDYDSGIGLCRKSGKEVDGNDSGSNNHTDCNVRNRSSSICTAPPMQTPSHILSAASTVDKSTSPYGDAGTSEASTSSPSSSTIRGKNCVRRIVTSDTGAEAEQRPNSQGSTPKNQMPPPAMQIPTTATAMPSQSHPSSSSLASVASSTASSFSSSAASTSSCCSSSSSCYCSSGFYEDCASSSLSLSASAIASSLSLTSDGIDNTEDDDSATTLATSVDLDSIPTSPSTQPSGTETCSSVRLLSSEGYNNQEEEKLENEEAAEGTTSSGCSTDVSECIDHLHDLQNRRSKGPYFLFAPNHPTTETKKRTTKNTHSSESINVKNVENVDSEVPCPQQQKKYNKNAAKPTANREHQQQQPRSPVSEHSHRCFYECIALQDLVPLATIGVGGFGRVALVRYTANASSNGGHSCGEKHKLFALKTLNKALVVKMNQQAHVANERAIQLQCHNDFIVRLYRTFRDPVRVHLLLEYCPGGDLWTRLRGWGHFDERTARFYCAAAIEALDYLRRRAILYRDLKPENMLLDAAGYPKLADFGFAKQLDPIPSPHQQQKLDGAIVAYPQTYTFCGTAEYVAPEVILNKGQDFGVDLWGLGIFTYELIAGMPPFISNDPMTTYRQIIRGFQGLTWARHVSTIARSFISKLCRREPTERLGYTSIDEIRRDPWWLSLAPSGTSSASIPSSASFSVLPPYSSQSTQPSSNYNLLQSFFSCSSSPITNNNNNINRPVSGTGFDFDAFRRRAIRPPIRPRLTNRTDTQNFDRCHDLPNDSSSLSENGPQGNDPNSFTELDSQQNNGGWDEEF